MIIDEKLFQGLLAKAAESPRLRMNFDLRTTEADGSQRMLNALLPGTRLPIHRHRKSAETVVVLRGTMTEIFYDDNGVELARYELGPSTGCYGLQIPLGMWHTIEVHEHTLLFEAKDGPYEPLSDEDILNK